MHFVQRTHKILLTSSAEVKGVELYLHSHNTPSCRGVQLKKITGTTLPYTQNSSRGLLGCDAV
jgi:hypothetical protein